MNTNTLISAGWSRGEDCNDVIVSQHQHQTNIKQTIRSIYLLVVSIYLLIAPAVGMALTMIIGIGNGREGAGAKVARVGWSRGPLNTNSKFASRRFVGPYRKRYS
jgi:hypothetical protein